MDSSQDWDLLALVRSCSSCSTTTTTTTSSSSLLPLPPPPPPPPQLAKQEQLCFSPTPSTSSSNSILFGFSTALPTTSFGKTDVLNYNTIINTNTSNFQSVSCSFTVPQLDSRLSGGVVRPSHVIFGSNSSSIGNNTITTTTTTGVSSHSQRIKKRKNLVKKVCHVPAEGLSSDMWAWRKYGQKPIKGSPYPRGYYRCSSSKGCLARKQVERNRSDPKMFIVTYTSEHNHPMPAHRNTLAGSTRQKTQTTNATLPDHPTHSSPSTASLSPLTESKIEDNDDMGGISELLLSDDFFVGFENFDGCDNSDDSNCLSEQFSSSSDFSWLGGATSTTTTSTATATATAAGEF